MKNVLVQRALNWLRRHAAVRDTVFLVQNGIAAVAPSHSVQERPKQSPCYTISALVRVKDEARFLPEWIAYHLVLGVEHFYVYDNGSSDGTPSAIEPFVNMGVVTLTEWPSSPISPDSERHFLREYARETEWIAFLDADEYIVEREAGSLMRLIRDGGIRGWPAIALNWRYFGSSWHEVVPDGLVVERFTLANANLNRHIKVVARTSEIHRTRNSHNFYYRKAKLARTPNGRRVLASFSPPRHADGAPVAINHYVYRSKQDAMRKVNRGFVDRQGQLDSARRASQVEADFGLNNSVTVVPDVSLVLSVQTVLSELGYPREIVYSS